MAEFERLELNEIAKGYFATLWPGGEAAGIFIGNHLIVAEGQYAFLLYQNRSFDGFGPGNHILSTVTLPQLNGISGEIDVKVPLLCELYFLTTGPMGDLKWGTPTPLTYQDEQIKMVSIRGRGVYSVRIAKPDVFIGQMVADSRLLTGRGLQDFLRGIIVACLNEVLSDRMKSVLQLTKIYESVVSEFTKKVENRLQSLGLELVSFNVESIAPPPEVQELIKDTAVSLAKEGK